MADMTDWNDDILSEDETDENIIELMDIADEENDYSSKEEIIELEEDVIDLMDIVKEESTDLDLEDETFFDEGLELEADDPVLVDDPIDGPTDDLVDESLVEDDQEIVLPQNLSLSPELLEAALEKVIEKKFSDKIETILFEVMEKVIEKEIAEIKESLQKDLNQIGNV